MTSYILGTGGDDVLVGSFGDDTFRGGEGSDEIYDHRDNAD
ncbi:hypothetical protein OAX30_04245 [Pseudomonadales bacterium]|nr:hypothetical protein [Pseudomonadales bacterium]MDC3357508.1 hypothetical protein [Pseudomonadales bacterium]